jgi:hypothetical protein
MMTSKKQPQRTAPPASPIPPAEPPMTKAKARQMAALTERVCDHLGLETLDDRGRDALDFHSISVASIREVIHMCFEAGLLYAPASPYR